MYRLGELGDGSPAGVELTLVRTPDAFRPATVSWAIVDGADDFYVAAGNISFVYGQASAIVGVAVAQDDLPEDLEEIELRLTRVVSGDPAVDSTQSAVTLQIAPSDKPYGAFALRDGSGPGRAGGRPDDVPEVDKTFDVQLAAVALTPPPTAYD